MTGPGSSPSTDPRQDDPHRAEWVRRTGWREPIRGAAVWYALGRREAGRWPTDTPERARAYAVEYRADRNFRAYWLAVARQLREARS